MPFSLLFVSEGFPYALFDPSDPVLPYQGPLNVDSWSRWLQNHPDQNFTKSISAILRTGAKIGYRGPTLYYRNTNHQLARSAP